METATTNPVPKKKFRIEPLGDRLIIKPDPAESYTEAGLIIPETAKERPQLGTIISAGHGRNQDNEIIYLVLRVLTFLVRIMKFLKVEVKPEEDKLVSFREADFKPGMRVLYGRYAGTTITFQGEDVLVMRFSDVVGIVHEE